MKRKRREDQAREKFILAMWRCQAHPVDWRARLLEDVETIMRAYGIEPKARPGSPILHRDDER